MIDTKYKILLASNSPRRQALLGGIDIKYDVCAIPDIDESYPNNLSHEDIPVYLAKKKAEAYKHMLSDDTLLITADTVVSFGGVIYEKPKDLEDAKQMIRDLSGNTHRVITGVCLTSKEKQSSFNAFSDVTFANIEESEIEYYIEKYKPLDKAGAYGVQEWIGYIGVENINGSYFNIMGLPIQRLYRELKQWIAL